MQQLQTANIPDAGARRCAAGILDAVPAVIRFIRSEMRSHRGADLSVPQFRTLGFLVRSRRASLSAVAEFLGLSAPAASRLVGRLVRDGLVIRRIPAGNRRQVALSASARGRAAWEAARLATQERLAGVVASLPRAKRQGIQDAMRVLQASFQPEAPAPGR